MKVIEVPGIRTSLDQIFDFVRAASAEAGLDAASTGRLQLAVDEIATNIVTHGCEEAGLSGVISVCARWDDTTLTVEIIDPTRPYDPRQRAVPASLEASLEDRPIGGLGTYLALKAVDHFDYTSEGGRNHSVFTMKRRPAGSKANA